MLFSGKNRPEPPAREKSLYPVLRVAGSLKEYQKELVKKEVASLSELGMVGAAFSGVHKEADHFREKLQELGQSFANIDQTAEQFHQVRAEIAQTVSETQSEIGELSQTSRRVQQSYEEMAEIFSKLQGAIREIRQCMGKTVSIADQTNILAINASIEGPGPGWRAGALPWWRPR